MQEIKIIQNLKFKKTFNFVINMQNTNLYLRKINVYL